MNRRPCARLIPQAILLAITVFFLHSFGNAEEGSYSSPNAPLVALKIGDTRCVRKLLSHPQIKPLIAVEKMAGMQRLFTPWEKLSGFGKLSPEKFFLELEKVKAKNLCLLILPPSAPPHRAVFTFETASDQQSMEAILKSCASVPDTAKLPVKFLVKNGSVTVASDKKSLDYLSVNINSGPARDWKNGIKELLATQDESIALWMNLPWAADVLSNIQMGTLRDRISEAVTNFRNTGERLPPSVVIKFYPEDDCSKLKVSLPVKLVHLTSEDPVSTNSRISENIFPGNSFFTATLSPSIALSDKKSADLLNGRSLWDAFESAGMICDRQTTLPIAATADALRTLAGLHVNRDFISLLGNRLAVGAWKNSSLSPHWAIAADISDPERLSRNLLLALEWTTFYSSAPEHRPVTEKHGVQGAVSSGTFRSDSGLAYFSWIIDPDHIIIASNLDAAESIYIKLQGNVDQTTAKEWLKWSCKPDPDIQPGIASALALQFYHPAGKDTGIIDNLKRAAVVANIQSLLGLEKGRLYEEKGSVVFEAKGKVPGLSLAGNSAMAIGGVSSRNKPSSPSASRAASLLRSLLSLQQIRKHMEIGGSRFSRMIRLLENEKGKSIEEFINRQFPIGGGADYTFSDVVRYVSGGEIYDNYIFAELPQINGNPVNLENKWVILAVPMNRHSDPILRMAEDGRIFWRMLPPEVSGRGIFALPEPENQNSGWQNW